MIDLNFSDYPDTIALLYSGGADSTLLYYLMAKQLKNKRLDLFILDRYNRPLEKAQHVFDLVNRSLNYYNSTLSLLAIPTVEQHKEVKTATEILESDYDCIAWGINKYPDDDTIRPKVLFNFVETGKLKLPFANILKHEIIGTFYELGIEHILHHTHSCGLADEQPCGQCFNCRERIWAYNVLKMTPELGL